ncbi:TPA: hypothetical protein L4W59_006377, partial [Pseudomonas aeruginosa]|nr:hypothetical protein [Pseudomonas aeruginosa]HBO5402243.1 hypothetical protein [Pseudomonas aeruginosa]
ALLLFSIRVPSCGSDSTRVKKWREQVGEACEELRGSGLVEHAWVNDDLVHCKR